MGRYTGKKCRIICQIVLTTTFFLIELIIGHVTNSMALIADSFHMLSDIIALIIAFLSVKMSPLKWSRSTFGYARAEVLGALVNSVFLVALCFCLFTEALVRFYDPVPLINPQFVLYVGVAGLLINVIGLLLFSGHSHGHSHGSRMGSRSRIRELMSTEENLKTDDEDKCPTEDTPSASPTPIKSPKPGERKRPHSAAQMNMRGVFLHLLADALGSLVVIISAFVVWQIDWELKDYVDPFLTIVLTIILLRSVWPLLLESALILLQTIPPHIDVEHVRRRLLTEVEDILSIHEFHIWQLTGDRIVASAHVRCRNLPEYMQIFEQVKRIFHQEGIHSTTVQPEFVEFMLNEDGNPPPSTTCAFECPPSRTDCKTQACCLTHHK